jgi:single-stranded-DNA-specific exonuclease
VVTTSDIRRRVVPDGAQPWRDTHPVLWRVLAARGATDAAAVDYRLGRLLPPQPLGGLDSACALLATAIREDQRITIVGDYDADGATGTAVLVRGLRSLGARHAGFRVPHRALHGYGLSPALVAELAEDSPDLLITVDNGIAAHAGVAAARAAGMRVLVTDHHLPGTTLPDADAIVNPNVEGDAFASKALPGVGVAFYLLLALRAHLRACGRFDAVRPEPDLSELLDVVALGTVADLVPLDFNNRLLVAAGLRRIRSGRACAGVQALLAISGRQPHAVAASDLAFALGPRINAAGRIDDMTLGIRCLLADDPAEAQDLARQLDGINAQRREIQAGMQEAADAIVAAWRSDGDAPLPAGLCLRDPGWHAGVVGLVASRVKDRCNRPVIALAPAGADRSTWQGSGRSVHGFHLRDALADIAARQPGLLERFGGHAMAAGVTVRESALDAFAQAFDRRVREALGDAPDRAVHDSDGELEGAQATLMLADLLQTAGPWGQGFPEPAFDGEFDVVDWKVMAGKHLRLTLAFARCGTRVEAVYFGGWTGAPPPTRLRALYQLVADEWGGERRARLLLRHVEPAEGRQPSPR